MLYRAYSNPMDLMNRYINQGRFGTFVQGFLTEEAERRKAENEKENNWKLWTMYIHSYSDKSFAEWKDSVLRNTTGKKKTGSDEELTDHGIQSILNDLFPQTK